MQLRNALSDRQPPGWRPVLLLVATVPTAVVETSWMLPTTAAVLACAAVAAAAVTISAALPRAIRRGTFGFL